MERLSHGPTVPAASPGLAEAAVGVPRSPTTSRRRLRLVLRRRRDELSLTLDTVGAAMGWSPAKVSRIETGAVTITLHDLTALLEFYQVTDADTVAQLLHLARLSRQPHWSAFFRGMAPAAQLLSLAYEDDAERINVFDPTLVADLAQTDAYARVVHEHRGRSLLEIEQLAALRQTRWRYVWDRPHTPAIQIVIPVSALGPTGIGGRAVMLAQIDHLLKLDAQANVELILTAPPAARHRIPAFTLLESGGPDDLNVVYLADGNDGQLLDDPADVDTYQRWFEQLVTRGSRGPAVRDVLHTWRVHIAAGASTAPGADR